MKVVYKGFELDAKREQCLAGYPIVYYSIFRISDGWELDSGFYDTADSIRTIIKDIKTLVDDYIANPQDYEEDGI